MNHLPVDDAREDFEAALATKKPVLVVAPTGSGKSTRLPLWLAEGDDSTGVVLVVEPRRVACRSLATFLAGQRGESVGESIGYRVRFDDRSSKATRVLFVTTGVALRMLTGDGVGEFSAVLVDEFHERGWEVDLITAVLLDARKRGRFKAPLVLTSATVDAVKVTRAIDAELVEASGRTYPVDISYRESTAAPSSDDLDRRVRATVEGLLDEDDGDILVFLPGKGEISDCDAALSGLAKKRDLTVLKVHGSLPPEKLSRAFAVHHDQRRVYLATNVAETSLTLPGVTVVVDSGLARMRIHRGGRSALALVPISKASMDQRAGRAGRVRPGKCVRLFSQRFQPREENRPEIERIELDDVLLQAAICGLDGRRFDDATWLTDPPQFAVEAARERLQKMGALDDAHRLTDRGRRMAALPVGGDEARILLDPPEELAGTAADLVALLQLSRDLLLPPHLTRRRKEELLEDRADLFADVTDEVCLQLRALRHGDPHRHGLHSSALAEARRIAQSLRDLLGVSPARPTSDDAPLPTRQALAEYLLARVPESAFVVRNRALKRRARGKARRGKSEPWGNGTTELAIWPFDPPRVLDADEDSRDPVAGLVLDHFWLGGKGTEVRGTGRMVLPCTYDELLDAGLGDEEISEVRAGTHSGAPYVRAVVETTLAGVTLESGERPLRGDALCREAARAILEGRILKPAGDLLLDDLHVWDLMARWPEMDRTWPEDTPTPPEPRAFLEDRLKTLGVQRQEDLMLLEPEDLRPAVHEELGAYRYDVESMAEDFPRVWEHLGCRYTVAVKPRSRKILLEPMDKKTARSDDPQARFVPRFRGFDVHYKNASRTVPIR